MADGGVEMSSAPDNSRGHEEETLREASKATTRSPKKKKIRRHRAHKNESSLGRVEEESDEERGRKSVSSRERRQMSLEGIDLDDIPTLNYVSDDKKPPVVFEEEPEEEVPTVEEEPREGEEEEIDDEDPSMTAEEKEAMYNAAEMGDIDLLEDCLDKPNSDINMIWYGENLLMAALKTEQEEMAEFLIDNGINYNYKTTIIDVKDDRPRDIEWYICNCRQLAFDKGLHDIVELIDNLNGDLFPFVKPKARIPRYRRPKPPTPEPSTGGESENDASSEASKDRSEDEGDGRMKKRKKKKRKDSRDEDCEKGKDDIAHRSKGERNSKRGEKGVKKSKENNEINDNDSGHHSCEDFVDAEIVESRKADCVEGSKQSRSRASSSKTRTGSSRCSTRQTTTTRSPSPPAPKSETFLKRFWFLTCSSDEGYSSLSSKSSPRNIETKPRRPAVPFTIPPRGTKSSLGMRQASLHRKAQAEQEDERPMTQRKIKLPGSYEVESSMWHGGPKDHASKPRTRRSESENITKVSLMKHEVPKRQDAHYMQMTASAFTKRKLEPNFRKAYSSLDFVSDRILKTSPVSGNRKILHQRQEMYSRTCIPCVKENVSLDFKSFNHGGWRPSSLPNSASSQLYRTVTRVF